MNSEKIFSYGTLQYESVQISTFSRKLHGSSDKLAGYKLSYVEITDQAVLAASGEAIHPILVYTGNIADEVMGMVFEITPEELELSDKYEVADYKRVLVQLESGINAWVYISAKD
ncbi:MAG: gamma-glutamylcyclotransferase family protein [Rickettsiales bacterium]|jgi:gamma-glutamylcyclotransferase (GGCT)/AIG2-like uncharacterized protein YtfP